MKAIFLLSVLSGFLFEFNKSAQINEIKIKAKNAYTEKNYLQAITYYSALANTYKIQDQNIILNKAHCYFKLRNYTAAAKQYRLALKTATARTRSEIYQQLGVIASYTGNAKAAIRYSKESLKSDPTNDLARYNFELLTLQTLLNAKAKVKKSAKGVQAEISHTSPYALPNHGNESIATKNKAASGTQEPLENVNPKGQAGMPANPGNQNKSLQPGKDGNTQTDVLQSMRFKEIIITPEKANMILEMMKSQEEEFLTSKRKYFVEKADRNQPDW